MAAYKTMMEKMADEGLQSFVVTYLGDDGEEYSSQYWADDEGHAGEQCDQDGEGTNTVLLVETQAEYEARTNTELDYGRWEFV